MWFYLHTLKVTVLPEISRESLATDWICYCILWCVHIWSCDHMGVAQVRLSKPLPTEVSWLGARLTATVLFREFCRIIFLILPAVAVTWENLFLGPACPIFSATGLGPVHLKLRFNVLFCLLWSVQEFMITWTHSGAEQKTADCKTLLAKEQDICPNRRTALFPWSHDIILKHTYLQVSRFQLTNQPLSHTISLIARSWFQVGSSLRGEKIQLARLSLWCYRAQKSFWHQLDSYCDWTRFGSLCKIPVKDAFPILTWPGTSSYTVVIGHILCPFSDWELIRDDTLHRSLFSPFTAFSLPFIG